MGSLYASGKIIFLSLTYSLGTESPGGVMGERDEGGVVTGCLSSNNSTTAMRSKLTGRASTPPNFNVVTIRHLGHCIWLSSVGGGELGGEEGGGAGGEEGEEGGEEEEEEEEEKEGGEKRRRGGGREKDGKEGEGGGGREKDGKKGEGGGGREKDGKEGEGNKTRAEEVNSLHWQAACNKYGPSQQVPLTERSSSPHRGPVTSYTQEMHI